MTYEVFSRVGKQQHGSTNTYLINEKLLLDTKIQQTQILFL